MKMCCATLETKDCVKTVLTVSRPAGVLVDQQPRGRRRRVQAGGHQPRRPIAGGHQLGRDQEHGGVCLGQGLQDELGGNHYARLNMIFREVKLEKGD